MKTYYRGNVVGFNPYQAGLPSCSAHGMKASSRYQGLCVTANKPSASAIDTYAYKSTLPLNTASPAAFIAYTTKSQYPSSKPNAYTFSAKTTNRKVTSDGQKAVATQKTNILLPLIKLWSKLTARQSIYQAVPIETKSCPNAQ